ncbi:hypothetical protein HQO42_14770 [Rhodococcus fascians]|nr:hypothetical protein [Rhodococcus fascians]MBY4237718.1 hypothetical protein [Rhodococcus fascians]MBY4253921.1 hypothetical protein [Rhodococcus fascians]MBY4269208.1 hypothetical protein [Rhodococcus fascians]
MTITPELIEEVAEWVRAFDDHADDAAAETLLMRVQDMKVLAAAEFGPDAALASALRTAYHDDGETHYAKYSSEPEQWLRMAAAARAHVDAERSEPKPRRWAKAAEIPDGVQFTPDSSDQGSWVRRPDSRYGYIPPQRSASGVGTIPGVPEYDEAGSYAWDEEALNRYAPFLEVLS